nr:type II toxin-antitoxin system antitoxin SocA domain-containing protein [Ensifer sp. ENS07]
MTNAEDNDVSNLKLQKLCYYAQGLVSAMRGGEPLFHEDFSAWDHGPVVPVLYHKYKEHGSQPIPVVTDFDVSQIEPRDRVALTDIYEYYAQFSAWRLRNMTHEERPWIEAYKSGKRISLDSLIEFFEPQIDEAYVEAVYGKAD